MFNMIRMELYRMFKTKSMYVIWAIMALVVILTTSLTASEYVDSEAQAEYYEAAEEIAQEGSANIGMTVTVPTEPGEKVTVYDLFFGNVQAKFIALFIVIFAVLFSTADLNSGYIKNIGGQVKSRDRLILAKMVSLFVYTVCTIGVFGIIQAISNRIAFGYLEWGPVDDFLKYFGITTLLHFALAMICMMVAIILRNNVVSMILAVCMCMNVLMILYSGIDKLVHKAGFEEFQTAKYMVTGKISMLPMEIAGKDCITAVSIAVIFAVAAVVICSLVFKKRDI